MTGSRMKQNEVIYSLKDFSFKYPYSDSSITWKGSYSIKKGDILLLSGESGSGKSTLLYALKGLIPETIFGKMTGDVKFYGQDLSKLSQSNRMNIGFLFQNPNAQMVNKTVHQELAFGLENLREKSSIIKDKIKFYSQKFEIENLLDRNVLELSGGEKQKIALISILLMEPEVILFDEPTAFLDPSSAKHFVEVFQKIVTSKTIVIIEHNLNYLENYVNRFISIKKNGEIREKKLSEIEWQHSFPEINISTHGQNILKINELFFSYKKNFPVLENIDLTLQKGEIISIIGNNGSGKTTLLKLITGVLRKYSGDIIFKGKNIKEINYKTYYKNISLLFQNPENHFIFNHVIDEVNRNNEVLQLTGLEFFKKRNPFTLSEGEKRRLSLAILWNLDREVFLLDEPTFGQDILNKEQLISMIEKMRNQGKSFIIASHDLPFVKAVSSRIMKLKNRKLEEING